MKGVLAVIPVRDGRAAPVTAMAELAGRPLLWYALAAARDSGVAERIVVASADRAAARYAGSEGVAVVALPDDLTPEAPAEAVLAHVLAAVGEEGFRPELVAMIAPQTPLRHPGRLDEALKTLRRERADSLLSVSPEPALLWRSSPGGLVPFYDPRERPPRRGAPAAWLHENGSLYVCRRAGLGRAGSRLFGKIAALEMTHEEGVRADDPAGLAICGALLAHVRPDWASQNS